MSPISDPSVGGILTETGFRGLRFQPQNTQQESPDMFCSSCGSSLPSGSRFCTQCGAQVTPEPEPASADSPVSDSPEPEQPAASSEAAATAPTFQFVCPHCGQGLEVEKSLAGQTGECPLCGKPVVVPSPEAAANDHCFMQPPGHAEEDFRSGTEPSDEMQDPPQSNAPSVPLQTEEADSPARPRPTGIFAAVKWGVITGLSLLALVMLSSAACGGLDSALTSKSFCYLLGGTVVVILITGLLTALGLFSGGVSELFRNLGLLAVPALLFSVLLVLAGIFLIYALKNSKDPLPYHQHVKTCPFCGSTSVPLEHGAQCPRCGHTV